MNAELNLTPSDKVSIKNEFESWWAINCYKVRDESDKLPGPSQKLKYAAYLVWLGAKTNQLNP